MENPKMVNWVPAAPWDFSAEVRIFDASGTDVTDSVGLDWNPREMMAMRPEGGAL